MTVHVRSVSRRVALCTAGGGAASLMLAGRSTAQQPTPVDRGAVKDGAVRFPPIASGSEAQEDPKEQPLAPKDRVGFAVLALGRLSVEEILPAFAQTKKCKLTALVSGTPEKLTVLGGQYGISAANCYSYDQFDKIAQNEETRVVYIVLPNAMHREFVLRAAAARKHILCEKPMATSVEDARSMIAAADQAKVKLMIAYRCRYQPHHLEIIKRAQGGTLGPVKLIEAVNAQNQGDPSQWRLRRAPSGGGALPDIGIYCLNAARAVLGEEPVEIQAQIYSTPGDDRFKEVEESIAWLMRFPSALCQPVQQLQRASGFAARRICRQGQSDFRKCVSLQGSTAVEVRAEEGRDVRSLLQIAAADHFAQEMDHMADCVLRDQKPRTPGEEGLRDMVLMDAIYQAARDRRTVVL